MEIRQAVVCVDNVVEWTKRACKQVSNIAIALVMVVCISVAISVFIDYMKRTSDVKKSELSSKLLWNAIGQCFYVELDEMNKYYRIIRVTDCDKTK